MTRTAVIFDVDGVLIDSYEAHFQSWLQMFGEHGESFTEEQFRKTFGRTSHDIIAALHGGELSPTEIEAWDNRKEALYRDIIREDFPAIAGAGDLLDALHAAGFKLGVGSSGPPANITLTLECLGRASLFGMWWLRVDVTRGKPDPQVFQIAGERLGVPPDQCVVVEDAPLGSRPPTAPGWPAWASPALPHGRSSLTRGSW